MFFLNKTIHIFLGWRFLLFGVFGFFINIRIIGLCSIWSFIFRSMCQFWDFHEWRLIIFWWGQKLICAITWALIFWCRYHWWLWVTPWWLWLFRQHILIVSSLWRKYGFCCCTGICINCNIFVSLSIVLDIIVLYLDLDLVFINSILDLDTKLDQIVVLK